jgi:hypothetical protein
MGRISSLITRGIGALQRDTDYASVTIGTSTFTVIAGSGSISKTLSQGGFGPTADARFIVLLADMPDPSAYLRHVLTDNGDGTSYRIMSYDLSPDGSHVTLSCNAEDQGA